MPSTLPRRLGQFELLELVSADGMGEVYRAQLVGSSRTFALKMLPEGASANETLAKLFIDEARMAKSVNGPNLARLVDSGEAEGEHYLLFEWVDGVTLEALLAALEERGERLSVDQVARLFARLAEILGRLHATVDAEGKPTRMVHRDVSPGNILIDTDGEPTLVDFGLSRSSVQRHRTEPGLVKGKFGYLAPEQLEGRADVRTDLFALGVCFYEALTGARLLHSPSVDESIRRLREFEGLRSLRALRPDVPEALDEVVCKLLSPSPDDRYENAEATKRAIYGAKPALILSGEDLDEVNGTVVARLFPQLERKRKSSPSTRTSSEQIPTVDVGKRIAGTALLVTIAFLGLIIAWAMMR